MSTSARGNSRRTRDVVGSPADSAVAFAGRLLQRDFVEDDNCASKVSYQAARLEPVRGERLAGPAYTQHLAMESWVSGSSRPSVRSSA